MKSKIISFIILFSIVFINPVFAAFPDVDNSNKFYDAIDYVRNQNIVNGYSDGNYKPDNEITRGEFTKIIINSKFSTNEIENCVNTTFPDISEDNTFLNYICLAKKENIVNGYSDGNFKPEEKINFAQASKIITNTMQMNPDTSLNTEEHKFKGYVKALSENKYIPNTISKLDQNINRGEMAEMIWRIKENIQNRGYNEFYSEKDNTESIDCEKIDLNQYEKIVIDNIDDLYTTISELNSSGGNKTILLKNGTYNLTKQLWITANNLIFSSESENQSDVKIIGKGMTGSVPHVFSVAGDNITIANLTIGEIANHAIQVHGESKYKADNLKVSNVRIYNTGEQMLKGSTDNVTGSDNGVVECSTFEYTENFGPQYYIGGIDVHRGKNWEVRNNTFKNIRSPEASIAEHAIHFWNQSENTLVENNIIINCDRGIGFGLGQSTHIDGTIRNNEIYNNGEGLHDDVGIGLESNTNSEIYNNKIYFEGSYPNAIEYRFSTSTGIEIRNNQTNRKIKSRDGGQANLSNNEIIESYEEYNFSF